MRDDTPTYAAEVAHAHAHAPEANRADLPGPDELDYDPIRFDDRTPLAVIGEQMRRSMEGTR